MKLCVGGMMERGGSTEAIAAFGKKTCGLYGQQCLLDYHAQYFRAPSDGKLAGFLLGMNKYSYFGGGSGWGGTGPGACSLWLKQFPEFKKPLGEPKGNMTAAKASWDGAVCDTEPAATASTRTVAAVSSPGSSRQGQRFLWDSSAAG